MNNEFQMMDEDEDQIDLLEEKKKSKDLSEFYEQNERLQDLKNQI